MKKLILSASLALSVAVVGNIFVTHQAHATFFTARGETKIYGIDRLTGTVSTQANPVDNLYIFPNDTQKVGWRASVWNSGDLGNQEPWIRGGTTVRVKNRYFNGKSSDGSAAKPYALEEKGVAYYDRPALEPLLIVGGATIDYYFGRYDLLIAPGSNKNWFPPASVLSGADLTTIGKTYCQYASANPAGYTIVPYPGSSYNLFGLYGNADFTGSHMACAEVAYNYNLVPKVETINSNTGHTIDTITTSSRNDYAPGGDPTPSKGSQWQITQVILRSGTTVPDGYMAGPDTQVPCNGSVASTASGTAGRYKPAGSILYCRPIAKSSSVTSATYSDGGTWLKDGSANIKYNPTSAQATTTGAGVPAGTICYVYSISSYKPVYSSLPSPSATAPYVKTATWNNSAMVCPAADNSKTPRVQIRGDDVRVGGKIDVSDPVQVTARLLGSWGEYASYSGGETHNFATASGFNDTAASRSNIVGWSTLTFANSQAQYGTFTQQRSSIASLGAKGVLQYFDNNTSGNYSMSSLATTDTIDFNSPGGLAGYSTGKPILIDNSPQSTTSDRGKTLKIAGGMIDLGKTYIIIATGSVEITGDIRYNSSTPIKELSQIPQVIIIAHDINIADEAIKKVTNVDAWLITPTQESKSTAHFTTPGVINTCSSVATAADLTTTKCNDQLVVNGPVITDRLLLRRTAGGNRAESANDPDPAEMFNNRGDAYLWAQGFLSSSGLKTTSTIELPPRY